MGAKKQKRFEKVVEWDDYTTTKQEFVTYSFISILLALVIGLFFGWAIVTGWWINKVVEGYKRNHNVYWTEIKEDNK